MSRNYRRNRKRQPRALLVDHYLRTTPGTAAAAQALEGLRRETGKGVA